MTAEHRFQQSLAINRQSQSLSDFHVVKRRNVTQHRHGVLLGTNDLSDRYAGRFVEQVRGSLADAVRCIDLAGLQCVVARGCIRNHSYLQCVKIRATFLEVVVITH